MILLKSMALSLVSLACGPRRDLRVSIGLRVPKSFYLTCQRHIPVSQILRHVFQAGDIEFYIRVSQYLMHILVRISNCVHTLGFHKKG
jgi:hypothetical protein